MGLEQLKRGLSTHLAADDASQVILNGHHIDGRDFTILNDELESTFEGLLLLAAPVETHTDGHPPECE